MKSDFLDDLYGGHTASIWVDKDDTIVVYYRDIHHGKKTKRYKIGEISPAEVAFQLDLDMQDGQIWLQKLVAIRNYAPCYNDMWFNGIAEFRDAACHPYSKQGRDLTKFFKRLNPKIKSMV